MENEIINEFKIKDEIVNEGAIILIDMPIFNSDSKMGNDITILRYDNNHTPLNSFSGLIFGLNLSFENQLIILRVFLRPDLRDKYNSNFILNESDLRRFIIKKLYELL